jgi:sialidase-1
MPSRDPVITGVFTNGELGIGCYRIPSLVVMGNGELLAMAEARVENRLDHGGPIRIVARISCDSGRTWGPIIEVARNVLPDGSEQVAQNPCPVVDLMDPDHPEDKVVVMFNKGRARRARRGRREIGAALLHYREYRPRANVDE